MLCRVPAYVGPGFPSPTTSQTSESLTKRVSPDSLGVGGLLGRSGVALGLSGVTLGLGGRSVVLDAGLSLGLGQLSLDLGGADGLGDVDDELLGVGDQGRALRQRQLAGQDLGADLGALDVDLDDLGDVGGLGLEGDHV